MKYLLLVAIIPIIINSQPKMSNGEVIFRYYAPNAKAVYLAGEFNNWSPTKDVMKKDENGWWVINYSLKPGVYQYKFVIDGNIWHEDPDNPEKVDDNYGGFNSIITVTDDGKVLMGDRKEHKLSDDYEVNGRIYLNIIWHQHQPLYLDPIKDQLRGPWVRAHATKDYYDMAATIGKYPEIHCTINLTSVLLFQLQEYYVNRLKKYVDVQNNTVNAEKYFLEMAGKTDPWIDMALKPTDEFNEDDDAYLYKNAWNSFGISDVMIERFPEYKKLKEKANNYTIQEKREIKFWHYLAWFDPDFLRGPVKLPDNLICDLSDLIEEKDGKFYLRHRIKEEDCNRIIAEVYKVCSSVIQIHKRLMYNTETQDGQIEVITTPYYHPILPLIYNTDIAKICQPGTQLPSVFSYPEDAYMQVSRSVEYYKNIFGIKPYGMWPAEGSVSEDIIRVMLENGIRWIATGDGVLYKSTPKNMPSYYPYKVDSDSLLGDNKDENNIAIVFRNTELSDKIGFKYQRKSGEDAADDFIRSVIKFASPDEDRLLTVILDGENAWEWYRIDIDGKEFLNSLYKKLTRLQRQGKIITVTTSEYLMGNKKRNIPAHPIETLREIEPLWPGSWINANFDTWIGEPEENTAWEYLKIVREDLEKSKIEQPDNYLKIPNRDDSLKYFAYKAWDEMYAAEGSDWFWWYGADQGAPGGDEPFDNAFITHLRSVYNYMEKCGWNGDVPVLSKIIKGENVKGGGVMAESAKNIEVIFTCDARKQNVKESIYIVGDRPELANWTPNKVKMYDDGTNGDEVANDGIWTITLTIPVNTMVQYKYTNSGKIGVWSPGEEFPQLNRQVFIKDDGTGKMYIRDVFGEIK